MFVLKAINNIFLFSLLAHTVSHEKFASISYLLSMGLMGANFMDFGYRLKLIKEFSGVGQLPVERVQDTFFVKIIVSIVFFILFVLFVTLTRSEEGLTYLYVSVFFLGAFFLSLANYFIQFFYAKKNYKVDFIANSLYTLILISGVLISLKLKNNLILNIGLTFFLASLSISIYSLVLFNREFLKEGEIFNGKFFTYTRFFNEMKKITPYSLHVMMGALFIYVDIIFVELYLDEKSLGTYFVYNRYIYGMSLVTMTLSTFLFPYIAQYYNEKRIVGGRLHSSLLRYQNYVKYLALFGSVLSVFIMKPLIDILFGENFLILLEYRYLIAFIFFLKIFEIIPSLIITCNDKQMVRVYSLLAALIISMLLYPLFLPKYGLSGAIYVNAFSIILVALVYSFFSYKEEKTFFGINSHE